MTLTAFACSFIVFTLLCDGGQTVWEIRRNQKGDESGMLLYRHYMDFDGNAQVLGMHIEWNFAEKNWSPFQNQCFHVLYAGLRLKVFKTPSACSGGNSVGEVGKRFSSPIIRIATPDEKSCRLFLLRMVQDLQGCNQQGGEMFFAVVKTPPTCSRRYVRRRRG
mgnify:CR=1 FL=1